jgi:hypothetical protein
MRVFPNPTRETAELLIEPHASGTVEIVLYNVCGDLLNAVVRGRARTADSTAGSDLGER